MLFVPATRPDRFSKAIATGTDIVIVDWEDAVAPNLKTEARNAVGTFFGDPTDRRDTLSATRRHRAAIASLYTILAGY